MKHSVTKTFTFDAGHRLSDYDGKCFYLHGHTYKLEMTIACDRLDDLGMVIDFNVLKEIYKRSIDSVFDHKMILRTNDPINEAIGNVFTTEDNNKHITWIEVNPTVENIAKLCFSFIQNKLPKGGGRGLRLDTLTLYETPTSYTTITKED